MGDWTGTVPSFPVGNLRSADMTTLADIDTALVTAWTSWTPTLTSITVGNGTQTAVYRRTGKTLDWEYMLVLGSTSAIGSLPRFTLPATIATRYTSTNYVHLLGAGNMLDSSGGVSRPAFGFWNTSGIEIWRWDGTPTHQSVTATTPWTWATGDSMYLTGRHELA